MIWYKNNNSDIVVSTRIRLARNVDKTPFPNALKDTKEVTEKEIRLTLENFYDKAYFMVRINEGTPGNVSGGALTHLTGNLYLLEADEATVTIERQLEKE